MWPRADDRPPVNYSILGFRKYRRLLRGHWLCLPPAEPVMERTVEHTEGDDSLSLFHRLLVVIEGGAKLKKGTLERLG